LPIKLTNSSAQRIHKVKSIIVPSLSNKIQSISYLCSLIVTTLTNSPPFLQPHTDLFVWLVAIDCSYVLTFSYYRAYISYVKTHISECYVKNKEKSLDKVSKLKHACICLLILRIMNRYSYVSTQMNWL